jgi:hypothetical protein
MFLGCATLVVLAVAVAWIKETAMSDRRYTFNLAAAEIAGSALRITVPRKEWDRFFDIIR